jgi:hypothetical protein
MKSCYGNRSVVYIKMDSLLTFVDNSTFSTEDLCIVVNVIDERIGQETDFRNVLLRLKSMRIAKCCVPIVSHAYQ